MSGVYISDEPGVCVCTVVVFNHYSGPLVDVVGILHRSSCAFEDGSALFFESIESTNSGFGTDEAGAGDKEIGCAVNAGPPGLHEYPVALVGSDVNNDVAEAEEDVARP